MAFWCEWASALSRKRHSRLGAVMSNPFSNNQLGLLGAAIPAADTQQLDFTICGGFLTLHLVSREEVEPLGCQEQVKCS